MRWIFAVFPTLLLAAAIVTVQLSGNDKAPVFVLCAVGVDLVLFIIACLFALTHRHQGKAVWINCMGAAVPLIYVAIIAIATHAGLIDSTVFLGFK